MKKILAIDTGGTKTIYALVSDNGEFLTQIKRAATPKEIDELKNLFIEIIKEYENEAEIISFATAGAVNIDNTRVESSTPNMPKGYNELDFSKLSKKPVYVENDANAAAWAEYKTGAAKGEDNTITITLGTGVGGGFMSGCKLVRGATGKGGEVGSMKIKNEGRVCTCGRKDCFESYASGTGLKMTAEKIAMEDKIFETSFLKDKKTNQITTYDIIEGLKNNDLYCRKVFNIWENDIITGLINITNIFNPQSIIISGGIGKCVDITKIEKAVNDEIVVTPVKIRHAEKENNSGLIGSALLAFQKFCV